MQYYIYIGTLDGIVVYVGKGSGDRWKHLNSGISSNYEANRSHFEGNTVDVKIVERFESESEAYAKESRMIEGLRPLWNYQTSGRGYKGSRKKRGGVGVQRMNKGGPQWRAYVHEDNKKKHIGYFHTEDEAKAARLDYY